MINLLRKIMKYLIDILNEIFHWCHNAIEAPTSLVLTVTCPNIMKLDWVTNSTDEDGFNIYRSLDNINWALIDTVGAGVITYTDSSGVVDTLYYYRVQAFNSDDTSDYSNIDSGICDLVDIKYGALYNWYAATDERNIANTGWHVPIATEIFTLQTYVGGQLTGGGHIKEIGLNYWNTPNTDAANDFGFNARGSGGRGADGIFVNIKNVFNAWSSDLYFGLRYNILARYNDAQFNTSDNDPRVGQSLRPLKDSTDLENGETGTYTGNDGKVYRTICIGTQEWLADNLCETKYRNGDTIPNVTDNAAWAALTTGAMCYYNNDINNA